MAVAPRSPQDPRRAWLVRVAIAVLAGAIGLLGVLRVPGWIAAIADPIELRILDWHAQLRGPLEPPGEITIVAIDEASLERIGHWPWPRSRTAELIARLHAGGARVIALDILLVEPDRNSALGLAQALVEEYRALGLDRAGGASAQFGQVLEEARAAVDPDRLLSEVMADTRRVVLPYVFIFPPSEAPALDDDARRRLNRSAIIGLSEREARGALDPLVARGALLPLESFHQAAAGAGHVNVFPDLDGGLRRTALVVRFGDGHFPSLMLETARIGLGLGRADVRLTADQQVQIGGRRVALDQRGLMLLTYYGPRGTLHRLSAGDVLLGSAPPAVEGHMVIVGFTALGLMDVRTTPFDTEMPGVETHATVLANVLEGRSLWRHAVFRLAEVAGVLLLAAASLVLLPRFGPIWGSVAALGLAATVAGLAHVAFRLGMWVELFPQLAALAVGHLGSVTHQVLTEERERRWIKRAFQQYAPPEVVETVARDPAALTFGGERRTMTVMFSDIRGFTTYSERHAPEEVVATLHEYLTAMVQVVFRHRGTLDKFIGDAIMALFGAPLVDPDHTYNACCAAVEMSKQLEQLNEQWRAAGRETLTAGIAITTGEMVVGNLGSAQRFTYTVTGDKVNLCSRLEGLTKEYQTSRNIIIGGDAYAHVRDRVVVRPLGTVTVRGREHPVDIYDLVDVATTAPGA